MTTPGRTFLLTVGLGAALLWPAAWLVSELPSRAAAFALGIPLALIAIPVLEYVLAERARRRARSLDGGGWVAWGLLRSAVGDFAPPTMRVGLLDEPKTTKHGWAGYGGFLTVTREGIAFTPSRSTARKGCLPLRVQRVDAQVTLTERRLMSGHRCVSVRVVTARGSMAVEVFEPPADMPPMLADRHH